MDAESGTGSRKVIKCGFLGMRTAINPATLRALVLHHVATDQCYLFGWGWREEGGHAMAGGPKDRDKELH